MELYELSEFSTFDGYRIEEFKDFKQRINMLDNEESIKWNKRFSSPDFSWINTDEEAFNMIRSYCNKKVKEAHELHCKREKIKEMFKDIDKEELIKYIKGEF